MSAPLLRIAKLAAAIAAVAIIGLAGLVAWLNQRGEAPIAADARAADGTPAQIERGAYLARAGNCATCHTQRGGAPYAGGRGIATPFGTVYAGNLTPDETTGLGRWSAAHFWRALHHGRSIDGRMLYPAFPYPNFTRVTREDSDAIYAYLRSLAPVVQRRRAHELRFPYDSQLALAVWRALYFRAGEYVPQPQRSAAWNRGAYLVRGLGHCEACHAGRNALGATRGGLELDGGLIPMRGWYAPSLAAAGEASVADWPEADIVALLKTGVAPRGVALGPMGDVVLRSTQHLHDEDLRAIASFLASLPQAPRAAPAAAAPPAPARLALGAQVYDKHCAECHGAHGEGAGASFAVESRWDLIDPVTGASVAGDDVRSGQLSGSFSEGFSRTVSLTLATHRVYSVFMLADAAAAATEVGSQAAADAFIDPVFRLGAGVDPELYSFSFSDGIGNANAVSEPGTLGLLGAGLLGIALRLRRRS